MGQSSHDVSGFSETEFTTQKKTLRSSQAKSERVQLLRQDYWQKVAGVDLENLVFVDKMGVLLGLARTNARALPGDRAYDFKPFYRGSKVSVIGAITSSKVLAVMTIDKSLDGSPAQ